MEQQHYLHIGVDRRFWGVDDEVPEGEAKSPLWALPEHHRLRPHPRKGLLQGGIGIWGGPISSAWCRLSGTKKKGIKAEPHTDFCFIPTSPSWARAKGRKALGFRHCTGIHEALVQDPGSATDLWHDHGQVTLV